MERRDFEQERERAEAGSDGGLALRSDAESAGRRYLLRRVFGMPVQPIGSIVPGCVEGGIMEVEGERCHCSGQNAGDTETLLRGH